jgi:hypothetical protein
LTEAGISVDSSGEVQIPPELFDYVLRWVLPILIIDWPWIRTLNYYPEFVQKSVLTEGNKQYKKLYDL